MHRAELLELLSADYSRIGHNIFGQSQGAAIVWNTTTPTGTQAAAVGVGAQRYVQVITSHEMGHAIGLDHVTTDGRQRMAAGELAGGWYNNTVSNSSTPPLADDRVSAGILYPNTFTGYSDFYASNVTSISGVPYPLSVARISGNITTAYPDNAATTAVGDNHAQRGQNVIWNMCYGNLGPDNTGPVTLTATLSTSANNLGSLPFGTFTAAGGLAGRSTACRLMNSVVPNTAGIGTNYFIVFGSGAGGNDRARVDRQLLIDP
jgi:hypothetical protein